MWLDAGRDRRAGVHRHAASSTWRRVEPCLAGPEAAAGQGARSPRSTRSSSPISPRNMATPASREAGRGSTGRASADADGARARSRPWRRRHRRDHLAAPTPPTPSVLVAAGLVARKARALGLDPQALGQDQPGAGLAGGDRLSRPRPACSEDLERDRLQPRRLWLHHLHRQFGAAARADLRGDQQERPRRRLRALGQPQFRGPRVARRARQLPRLAAAGRRLCAQGHGGRGHDRRRRSAQGSDGAATSISRTSGRPTTRSRDADRPAIVNGDMFRARYADVYKGDAQMARRSRSTGGDTYAWSAGSTYIQNPPYFEGMTMTPVPPQDIVDARPLAIFGDSITTDHISPRRRDQGRQPGRQISAGASGRAAPTSTPTARGAAITK